MSVSPVTTRTLAARFVNAVAQVLRGQMLLALGGAFWWHSRKALVWCCSCRCSARLASPSVKDRRQAWHTPSSARSDGLVCSPRCRRCSGSSSSSRSRTPRSSARTRSSRPPGAAVHHQSAATAVRRAHRCALVVSGAAEIERPGAPVTVDIERVSVATYELFALTIAVAINVTYLAVALDPRFR